MQPRSDARGVVLDSYSEVFLLNQGLGVAMEKAPQSAGWLKKELITIFVAAQSLPNISLDLARSGQDGPEIRVPLDEIQTNLAHTILRALERVADDEMERDETKRLRDELTAAAQMSHELVTATS